MNYCQQNQNTNILLNISSWSAFCWSHLIKCVGARIMFARVIFNKGAVKGAGEGLINFIELIKALKSCVNKNHLTHNNKTLTKITSHFYNLAQQF